MKIENIYIKSFAGARDVHIAFSDEITVIHGANEAGKSSITAFIRFMFYGFQNKEERNRYIHWEEQSAAGTMDILAEGSRYRINRIAPRDSARGTVEIIDLTANTTLPAGKSPAELFLGVPVQVYDNTAYISQIEGSRVGGKDLATVIENLLFHADENVNIRRALGRLDEARIELLYKNQKGGKLYELTQARAKIREEIAAARRTQDDISRVEGELVAAKQAFEEAKNALSAAEARKQTNAKQATEQRYRRFAVLMRTARDTARAVEDLTARYTFDGQIASVEDVTKLRTLQADIQTKEEQIAALAEELESIQAEERMEKVSFAEAESSARREADTILSEYRANVAAQKSYIWGAVGAFATTLAASILFVLFLGNMGLTLTFAMLAALSLGVGVVSVAKAYGAKVFVGQVLRRHHATDEKTLDRNLETVRGQAKVRGKRLARYKELDDRRRELVGRRDILKGQADIFCARYRVRTLAQAITVSTQMVAELDEARRAADGAKIALDTYREEHKDLDQTKASEMPVSLGEEPELPPAQVFTDAVEAARREVDRTRILVHELEKRVTALQAGAQNLTHLEESLEPLSRKEASLQRMHSALCMAYEALEQASAGLRSTLAPTLSAEASRYMALATGGKYETLGVGSGLHMEYRTGEPGATNHATGFLSAGTQDIAYISLRLALIRQLYAVTPPIIFDETFTRLDDSRMFAMMKILAQTAQDDIQVIMLTSQSRDAKILNQVTGFSYIQI